MKKKGYQQPVTRELLITRAAPLLAGSHFVPMDSESGGGIKPGTYVSGGLSRECDYDDDFDDY